jgi:CheY-like chemotaxis protein
MSKFFLLADDDVDDAELFGEALVSIEPPVEFHHVGDGEEVFHYLGKASNKRPDLIFLDLNMPKMSGWQCLAKLKNDMYYKNIPVIIYSTSSHQRDKEIAIELGAMGFLTKPSDFKLLKKLLYHISLHSNSDLKNVLSEVYN